MSFIYYLAMVSFIFVSVLLCFVVLIQESKSSGLGSAFGAGESGQSIFGTATADILTKFTTWLAVIFMVGCIVLSAWTGSVGRARDSQAARLMEEQQRGL